MGLSKTLKYLLVFSLGAYIANFVLERERLPTEKCEVCPNTHIKFHEILKPQIFRENILSYRFFLQKGVVYKIRNISDFDSLQAQKLECIFRSGVEPSKIPIGPLYGDVISIAGQPTPSWIRSTVTTVWHGKYLSSVPCSKSPGKNIFLGWNYAFGNAFVPFVAWIGKLQDSVKTHPSYYDGKKSLIFDYKIDYDKECPEMGSLLESKPQSFNIKKSPLRKNLYPTHRFLDEIRLVGRQVDGGAILLGVVYLKDAYKMGGVWSEPIAYFTLVSYDGELNKNFLKGQALQPLVS
jgi:hypothetical protein